MTEAKVAHYKCHDGSFIIEVVAADWRMGISLEPGDSCDQSSWFLVARHDKRPKGIADCGYLPAETIHALAAWLAKVPCISAQSVVE